jgi:hypothetical protein
MNLRKSVGNLKHDLRAFVEHQLPRHELLVSYHIGDEFSGDTAFRLHGDGGYELQSSVTRGRKLLSFSGQIGSDMVEELVRGLLASKVWEANHSHVQPGEDDPEASLTVQTPGHTSNIILWISEIRDNPQFARAQELLLDLIHKLSQGEVLENGQ